MFRNFSLNEYDQVDIEWSELYEIDTLIYTFFRVGEKITPDISYFLAIGLNRRILKPRIKSAC